jgi:CRISPR-associated protein Csc3
VVNHPQKLVELYCKFYRADRVYQPSARKCIQPLYDACEIICTADSTLRNSEMLIGAIAGKIQKLMDQIHSGNGALGRYVISDRAKERQNVLEFAQYLVDEVFYKGFNGDVGRFMGKQRGYIENTCEFIYRIAQDKENKAKDKENKAKSDA